MQAPPLRPRAIGPGAKIVVVAPSGPVPEERLAAGLAALAGLELGEISLAPGLRDRAGYLAGGDDSRRTALQAALDDPEAAAIICARGGYGLTRLLPALDPTGLRAAPKLVVGFSDATALLCWTLRAGFACVHGPVAAQLGELGAGDLARLATLLRGEVPAPLVGVPAVGTRVTGALVAANVEVLRSLVGTPWLPDLRGCVVALEEIGERPYRIDRALTQLLTSGALAGVRGFAVGRLHACEEPASGNPESPSAVEVVRERLATLGVPVVTGFGFGHEPGSNAALPCGTQVELDPEMGTLNLLEAVARRG